MEDILIIGSKDYKINLNNILDKFEKNIRINGSMPNGNNGTKTDILYLNNHIYDNFFLQKKGVKELSNIYKKKGYNINFFENLVNCIKNKKYTKVLQQKETGTGKKSNTILKKLGVNYNFSKAPRSGIQAVIHHINSYNIFVYGFSLDKKNNKHFSSDTIIPTHMHSEEDEHNILKDLHNKKIIDVTLCMLEYNEKPILNCEELEPREETLDLLLEKFERIEIRGDNYIKNDKYTYYEEKNLMFIIKS